MTTEDRIRDMLGKNRVFLFMKGTPQQPQCGFSMRAVSILRALDVPYATFDILTDPEVRQGVKDFANWQTFPQLWIDQQLVGGSDIMMEMWEQGELEDMVKDIPKSA
ncbi:MAG: Grx4 family monothiol glutaredoxin [Myxococcales bacterium]|nr:Grx4 family monothiol glutaredoxin [Myxococcales bacterium]